MPVKRVLGFAAAVLASGVCAGIIESSNGNANVTPAPRRNARRGYVLLGDEHCNFALSTSILPLLADRQSLTARS